MDVTGSPRLKIDMDPADWGEKWAAYESGGGTTGLTFAHTVVEPNKSTQGIAVLANSLDLNGGALRSASSQTGADLSHGGLDHDSAHKVDWEQSSSEQAEQPTPTPEPQQSVPGSPANLAVSATAGQLALSATWDALEGADSYRLSWRRADGDFEAANVVSVPVASAGFTVSGYGQWVVQVDGCNDAGCGPAVTRQLAVESPPEPGPLHVAITASPDHPQVNGAADLGAVITNPPPGEDPSYSWEVGLDGGWYSYVTSSTLRYLAGTPETLAFRVTVTYGNGDSATSAPLSLAWTSPDNGPPVVNTQAEHYARFTGQQNAPRGMLVSKPFHGIFSDPDGDELTYTVSIASGNGHLVESLEAMRHQDVPAENRAGHEDGLFSRVWFTAEAESDWKALNPQPPDRPVVTVTLTATDPRGLSASLDGDFLIRWETYPELVSAVAGKQAITLTFDMAVEDTPGPAPAQFTVNVVNADGTAGTAAVNSVAVNGSVVTLGLASELTAGQTATLDYAEAAGTPLRAAGGWGDPAPRFSGQAVDMSSLANGLSLAPARLTDGSAPPERVTASWNPVPGASSYNLRWRPSGADASAGTRSFASGSPAGASGSASGASGASAASNGGAGATAQAWNNLNLPGDQVSADFNVESPGSYDVALDAYSDDDLITSFHNNVDLRVTARLNALIGYIRDPQGLGCQARTIDGLGFVFTNNGIEVSWDDPGIPAITRYQVRVEDGSLYISQRETGWTDIENSHAGTTSHTLTNLAMNNTYGVWIQAVAGDRYYCSGTHGWVTPFNLNLPAITGLEAYQDYFDDGPEQLTLSWDDHGERGLGYEYEIWPVLPTRLLDGGPIRPQERFGQFLPGDVSVGWDGKLQATISGIRCENHYVQIWLRAKDGDSYGPESRLNYASLGTDHGTPGNDTLTGDWLHKGNCVIGWGGDDRLYGNEGDDLLKGRSGNDVLEGRGGSDTLEGGRGDDILDGGPGDDALAGGPGTDTARYPGPSTSVIVLYDSDRRPITVIDAYGHGQRDTLTGIERVAAPNVVTPLFVTARTALNGTDGDDWMYGTSELDWISGLGGNDTLYGFGGDDSLDAYDGDDVLIGGPGGDALRGGDGTDTASYATSAGAVAVSIATSPGSGSGGDAQSDELFSIENLTGSVHDDTLTGDGGNNVLRGGRGNDTLKGLGGSDTLDGGPGTDTASYEGSGAAVTVDLATGSASGGDAQGDTLVSIENLTGSAHDDTLTGNGGNNVLNGGGGNNRLTGGPGDDRLIVVKDRDATTPENHEFIFHKGFGRDTIEGFHHAHDTIKLCGMTGVNPSVFQATRSDGTPYYYISIWADDSFPGFPGLGVFQWFQGSITLEGSSGTLNTLSGNLPNIVVSPALQGLTCEETIIADANSPQDLGIESHYGLGVSSVSWEPPSGGAAVTGYAVEWLEAATGEVKQSALLGSAVRSYDIGGKWLAGWVRVAARTGSGDAWSVAVAPPADPLQVWFGGDTPSINRTTAVVSVQSAASKSVSVVPVCRLSGGQINCPPGQDVSLNHPGGANLPLRTEAVVTVEIARTGDGETASAEAETQAGGPSPPSAAASGGNSRLKVGWNEPSADPTHVGSINGYVVQLRSRNAGGTWSAWADTVKAATDRAHTFTGLAEGTWQVRVRARTDGNDGDPNTTDSDILGATSPVRTVAVAAANDNLPGAPGASVAVGNQKLTLTWQRPDPDTGSLVHGYTVRHKVSGAADSAYVETKVYPRPGLASGSVEFTGLTSGTAYVVQIRSHNANGDSGWVTIGGAGATHTPCPCQLVGNTGESVNELTMFSMGPAQAFTTGSNPGGYKLTGVDLVLSSDVASSYSVSICTNSSCSAGAVVGTLQAVSITAGTSAQVFSSSASGGGIDLAANTTYFVRPTASSNAGGVFWNSTLSDSEEGLEGFTIADGNIGGGDNQSFKMAIQGYPK